MATTRDTVILKKIGELTEVTSNNAADVYPCQPLGTGTVGYKTHDTLLDGLALAADLTTLDGLAVKKDGTVPMTGDLDLGTNKIINLDTPTSATDAATKGYVDGIVAGNPDGWNSFSGTPTFSFAAAQQLNTTIDYTTAIQKGDKLKLTQDATTKYFYVTAVTAGTISLAGEVDLTVNAITDVKFSKIDSPQGFKNGEVYFNAWARGDTPTTLVDGVFSQVVLDNEVSDQNSNFATNTYTIPVSGFYKIDFGCGVNIPSAVTAGADFFADLFVNGADAYRGSRVSSSIAGLTNGEQISVGSVTIGITKGDTLELFAYYNAVDNVNRATTAFSPYMMVTFLHV